MSGKMLFVVNRAVERRREHLEARCGAAARRLGFEPSFLDSTADSGDWDEGAALLSAWIAQLGAGLVVAVGGDGTVGACAQVVGALDLPLAIVPRGAANLVAHALDLPFGLEAALHAGLTGEERVIDLAVANGRAFVAMAGLGLDAAVVQGTSVPLKRHLGWLGYALVGVSRLHSAPRDFEVRLDGGDPLIRRARAVVVGNVGTLPGGFPLLPGAHLDDGLLDVGLLAPEGTFGWLELAGHLLAARLHDSPPSADQTGTHGQGGHGFVEHHQAHGVEIVADQPLPCEADGEVLGATRTLTVQLRSKGLRVRVPHR